MSNLFRLDLGFNVITNITLYVEDLKRVLEDEHFPD